MGISLAQLLLVLIVILILFGAGKLPQVMEQLGRGIKNFKKGLKNDHDDDDHNKKRNK